MKVSIKKVTTGYLIIGAFGECYQKSSLLGALDFCRVLGFKPVITI